MSTLVTTALRHNASASNNVVLDSNGRVGIGTATPVDALHVVGQGLFATGGNTFIQLASNDGAIEISRNAGGAYIDFKDSSAEDFDVRLQSIGTGGTLGVFTNGAERMRIDTSGRVTKPFQPMASGAPNRGGDWFTGTVAPVTAHVNIGSHMNTTTGIFTAPVAGRYYVYIGLLHNNTWYIYVNINGNAMY